MKDKQASFLLVTRALGHHVGSDTPGKRRSHEFWAFDRPKIGMLKDASHQTGMVTEQDWGIVCPTKMWSWSTKRRILANQTSNMCWISRVNCQWTSTVIFMKNQLIYAEASSLMNSWRDQVHQWGYDQASGRKPPALKMEKERQPKNGETTNKPVIQLSKSIQDVQQAAL